MRTINDQNELKSRIQRISQRESNPSKPKINLNKTLFGLLILMVIGSYAFSNSENPTVSVALDKMNVLYVGIENPITVAVTGIAIEDTKIESDELEFRNLGNGHFIVYPSKPGLAKIKVHIKGHAAKILEFKVEEIPNPVFKIDNSSSGFISAETFAKSEGIDAVLENFDFDATCEIVEFTLRYSTKVGDNVESFNQGNRYNDKTKALVLQAKAGDIYSLYGKYQCPGNAEPCSVYTTLFRMK